MASNKVAATLYARFSSVKAQEARLRAKRCVEESMSRIFASASPTGVSSCDDSNGPMCSQCAITASGPKRLDLIVIEGMPRIPGSARTHGSQLRTALTMTHNHS
jgi:hypothetical protein